MSKLYNVKQIVEFALQEIRHFGPHETGADPDYLRRGLDRFEILASEVFAVNETLWIEGGPAYIDIPISPNPFDLVTAAGAGQIDPNRFQLAKEVWLRDTVTGRDKMKLELMSRESFFNGEDRSITGRPDFVYIDRQELNPRAFFDRSIAVDTYQLGITWYEMSPTFAVTGAHEFPRSWQRYMSLRLARDLGSGPIRRLSKENLDDLDGRIKDSKADLMAHHNRQTRTPRKVQARDLQ